MTNKKIILGKQSHGHAIQSNQTQIVVSFDTNEGVVQIAMEKTEAAQLVSGVLNEGKRYTQPVTSYSEVTADHVRPEDFSLSANINGLRYLGLINGGVNISIALPNDTLLKKMSDPGDEIHMI